MGTQSEIERDNGFIWPPGGVAPVIYPEGWIGGTNQGIGGTDFIGRPIAGGGGSAN